MSDTVTSYLLKRDERLKSRSTIQDLFSKGDSLFVFPLKLIYTSVAEDHVAHPFIVGVTVPKRNHKKAHIRNLLKRRIREAYRKNKPQYKEQEDTAKRYALMYVLVDQKITDYDLIERSMVKLNKKLITKITSSNG